MQKFLLISEKPSLMRLVKDAFYKSSMKNQIEVDMVSLHGHCCTLATPEHYSPAFKSWKMETIPIIPENFEHIPVEEDLVNEIADLIKSNHYDGMINCTDAEREGQNIFYSLYHYLGLNLPVKRYWVSDLTESKLIEAWENLREDQKDPFLVNLTSASMLRAEFDWLIGMNFSRVVSITNQKVIPVGRVMSVVLSLLAKRENEIKNFKPETSYNVLSTYNQGFDGLYSPEDIDTKSGVFKTQKEADDFIKTLDKQAKVFDITIKERKEYAPLLYSLGDLQNDANQQYGFTLAYSLSLIQSLYEKKILSYPRTDSNYLTTGEAKRISAIVDACKCLPELENVNISAEAMRNYPSSRYVNDQKVQAHYAIVFTGLHFTMRDVTEDEYKILILVAKRILSTLLPPAIHEEASLTAIINGDHPFATNEKSLLEPGFKILYDKKKEPHTTLKDVKQGDILDVDNFSIKEVVTTCPPRYTDASLNKAMINVASTISDKELQSILKGKGSKDQGGIGTPATRSGIVEKLLQPKQGVTWVKRKGKSFHVTEDGLEVAKCLEPYSFSSAILTATWEKKLQDIEEGRSISADVKKEMVNYIKEECEELKKAQLDINNTNTMVTKTIKGVSCPFCGKNILASAKYFYCEGHTKEDKCFIIPRDLAGADIEESDIISLCKGEKTTDKIFKSKKGSNFIAALKVDTESKNITFVYKEPETILKHDCGGNIVSRNGQYGKYYRCDKCNTTINETFLGKRLTEDDIKNLFRGEALDIYGLISNKTKKKFNAKVQLVDGKLKIIDFLKSN